jgi:hypothetical protein
MASETILWFIVSTLIFMLHASAILVFAVFAVAPQDESENKPVQSRYRVSGKPF